MSSIDLEWERRLSALWASIDDHPEDEFVSLMDALVAALPEDDPVGPFEWASALDSTGRTDEAVPQYRRALELGLGGLRRRRAVIQMASSLRVTGRASESVALLRAEREAGSDELDDAVDAFLALALVETGREREAVSIALTALSGHMTRYRRSLENYARELAEPDRGEPAADPSSHRP